MSAILQIAARELANNLYAGSAWVVRLDYLDAAGKTARKVLVLRALPGEPIDPMTYLPQDAVAILRGEAFAAYRFADMDLRARPAYAEAYAAWLKWQYAERAGKPVEDLSPWQDFDPIYIDERTRSWVAPNRYTGD